MGVTLTDTPDDGGVLAPAQPKRGRSPAVVQPKPLAVQGDMTMLNLIAAAATNPNVDVAKLGALLDMQRQVEQRQAEREFTEALHAAQSEVPAVAKNGTITLGGKGNIPFATLEDVMAALRPIMDRNGLSVTFDNREREGGGLIIQASLSHRSGAPPKIASMPLPIDNGPGRNPLQAMGSTLSYGRRYTLEMLFNIVRTGADDDGKEGGSVYVDEVTAKLIEDLLTKSGANRDAFLDYMGAEDVPAILERDKAKAINGLMARLNRPREAAQ